METISNYQSQESDFSWGGIQFDFESSPIFANISIYSAIGYNAISLNSEQL